MAILKLNPACKDYIWGGNRLMKEFGKPCIGERLAETWELSCHPDGPSVIANGPWQGKTLTEYLAEQGNGALGTNCERFSQFPILIKLIDAADNLSIQVHPDDEYARRKEGQYGKTEMWYVADCTPDAYLYYGFSREISAEEFSERIQNNTLLEVLNRVPVQKGDVFFIEAGTIHAIGKGILVAEIQQNSNVTYRVYDYGRRDKNGCQRELHVEKAIEVTQRTPRTRNKSAVPHLASCKYFTVDKLYLDGCCMQHLAGVVERDSFLSLLILEGNGTARCGEEQVEFKKGDSLFLPAGSGEFELCGTFEALSTRVEPVSDRRQEA